MNLYILDENDNPVLANSSKEWYEWIGNKENKIVKVTYFKDATISTVFLGINHGWDMDKNPILFETMIFGGKYNKYMFRYCTKQESIVGHMKALTLVLFDLEDLIREFKAGPRFRELDLKNDFC